MKNACLNILTYCFLFVCIFTSNNWIDLSRLYSSQGEIFRFDRVLLFGQANIYHLLGVLFFIILFFVKFGPNNERNILGDRNYLKGIFIIYFIPVNLLLYFAVYTKGIILKDLGVSPIILFFVYLSATFYIQDIFFKKKSDQQVINILTALEALILFRCCYSIIKYLLGFGASNPFMGGIGVGAEDDFADFFILLFIIALTRLLFSKNESRKMKIFHISGIITSSYVAIFSFRRYFWSELLIAIGVIFFFHVRYNKVNINKKIIVICLFTVAIMGSILLLGNKLTHNYYIGRLLTSASLLDSGYTSKYGTDSGHADEISDGWYNVKNNWMLGITPFGDEKMRRFKSASWQKGLFVHNAYLCVWLQYGFLGFVLFILLYIKSLKLGYFAFFKLKNYLGLILLTFMLCQMVKNFVWPTAITNINTTVIYIFLISLVLKIKQLESEKTKHTNILEKYDFDNLPRA